VVDCIRLRGTNVSANFDTQPVVGGTTLIIPAIQSPNFLAGSAGWEVNASGTAQFNQIIFGGNNPTPENPEGIALQIDSTGEIVAFNDYGCQVLDIAPSQGSFIIYFDYGTAEQGLPIFTVSPATFTDFFGNKIPAGVSIGYTGVVPPTPPSGQMNLYIDGSGNLLGVTQDGNTRTIAAV
jgi:hypothetical protein